ncbi:TetR family transcriptional regulator [Stackebrandtia endophytica]|uniref:TetR family transcriptional regulator n=1 Tax=Stackebrandtia endophytica TaxID=1496996 RepID=A0A543ATQ4_9ACTN|nr:TetR/AcrR family transcriptional regulator [Stackebrandtia endophytica]TQL75939.1 TetR family transcriptional regulator [Stackebrandtia endophytica]
MTPKSQKTRARIQQAAIELFLEQGVRETALWQIADRLNMTKPALYYYFSSRDELINSLIAPVVEQTEAALADLESNTDLTADRVLAWYFDINIEHRAFNLLVLRDLSLFTGSDLGQRVAGWRRRLVDLLVGADADLSAQARAVIALGGISDCVVMFTEADADELRTATLAAASAAMTGG